MKAKVQQSSFTLILEGITANDLAITLMTIGRPFRFYRLNIFYPRARQEPRRVYMLLLLFLLLLSNLVHL
jgi:hypothetical protein